MQMSFLLCVHRYAIAKRSLTLPTAECIAAINSFDIATGTFLTGDATNKQRKVVTTRFSAANSRGAVAEWGLARSLNGRLQQFPTT